MRIGDPDDFDGMTVEEALQRLNQIIVAYFIVGALIFGTFGYLLFT